MDAFPLNPPRFLQAAWGALGDKPLCPIDSARLNTLKAATRIQRGSASCSCTGFWTDTTCCTEGE